MYLNAKLNTVSLARFNVVFVFKPKQLEISPSFNVSVILRIWFSLRISYHLHDTPTTDI